MLTISADLAQAFETGTLARWKADIAHDLRIRFPEATARFAGAALEAWVQDAMDTLSRQGKVKWPDLHLFTVTLFAVTEAEPDAVATGDLMAIMTSPASLPARLALLHKAFGAVL
jgi:hypothetical protein